MVCCETLKRDLRDYIQHLVACLSDRKGKYFFSVAVQRWQHATGASHQRDQHRPLLTATITTALNDQNVPYATLSSSRRATSKSAVVYSMSSFEPFRANCAYTMRRSIRQVKKMPLTLSERFGLLRRNYKLQSPTSKAQLAVAPRRVEIVLVGKRHYEVLLLSWYVSERDLVTCSGRCCDERQRRR